MLKLGSTYNILHLDTLALPWFGWPARQSGRGDCGGGAAELTTICVPALARFRTTVWVYPFFSTRWHDTFGYGQVKTDLKLGDLPFRPYVSLRLFGDTKLQTGGPLPQYLSESSVVLAAGVASNSWRGLMAWGEAGSAISYLERAPPAGADGRRLSGRRQLRRRLRDT